MCSLHWLKSNQLSLPRILFKCVLRTKDYMQHNLAVKIYLNYARKRHLALIDGTTMVIKRAKHIDQGFNSDNSVKWTNCSEKEKYINQLSRYISYI